LCEGLAPFFGHVWQESNQVLTFNTAAKPLIDAGHTPGLIGRHRLLPRRAAV